MKTRIYIMLCFFLFAIFSIHAKSVDQLSEKIDSLTEVLMEKYNIPGCVVSIVSADSVLLLKGAGYENIEENIRVNPQQSKFRVASITKSFTTLAIMDFVDQGKLDLQTDVREYLGDHKFSFDKAEPITLHHILSHTAGFEYSDRRLSKEAAADSLLKTFAQTSVPRQVYPPGEIFSYSNQAYSIAGYLIEKLSGMRYEDYMDRFIREKMEMYGSTFYQHTEDHSLKNVVHSYTKDDGIFTRQERQFASNPSATTLNATGADMAKFMRTILNEGSYNGAKVISKSAYRKMFSTQYQSFIDTDGMGYGTMISDEHGYRMFNHGGGITGFVSLYNIIPEAGYGIFISQSARQNNAGFTFELMGSIWDILLSEKLVEKKIYKADKFSETGSEYTGIYQLYTTNQSTFERAERIFGIDETVVKHDDDHLIINGNQYAPIGPDLFQRMDADRPWKFGFKRNEEGQIKYGGYMLYGTFKKIPWFKRVIAIQIGLIFGLVASLIFFFYRLKSCHTFDRLMRFSTASIILGFGTLLSMYVLDISIRTGAPLGYKLGLWLTTLGAVILIVAILVLVVQLFKKQRVEKKRIWISIFQLFASGLIAIIFWELNLIGFNYY